jgi:two-component system, cell cycle sensor histidine kinase and response regulator CckA
LGDAGQIDQVLLNLCLNARDAMPLGGTLTMSVREEGGTVKVRVSDTGTGMTNEVKQKIFEPFFTTKGQGKGTGLGLATVFGIVEAHGGRITCESQIGVGTSFELQFPAHERPAAVEAVAPAAVASAARGERILLADDEPMIRQLAKLILEGQGFKVSLAVDGVDAVQQFQHGEYDLIILDLTMPNLAGREALAEIRKTNLAVPVLLTSGYSQDKASAMAAANGFLEKPFTPQELAQAARAALRG